jgi:hypothetical protein
MARHSFASRELLPLVLRPPGAVLPHGGIGHRFQPLAQERLLVLANAARAAGNRLALQRAGRALLHHRGLTVVTATPKRRAASRRG